MQWYLLRFGCGFAAVHRAVDDEIVAFPAGLLILVGVEQQPHPIFIVAGRELLPRLRVEIDVRRVAGDFHQNQIVAAAAVFVMLV